MRWRVSVQKRSRWSTRVVSALSVPGPPPGRRTVIVLVELASLESATSAGGAFTSCSAASRVPAGRSRTCHSCCSLLGCLGETYERNHGAAPGHPRSSHPQGGLAGAAPRLRRAAPHPADFAEPPADPAGLALS